MLMVVSVTVSGSYTPGVGGGGSGGRDVLNVVLLVTDRV